MLRIAGGDALRPGHESVGLWHACFHNRHCEPPGPREARPDDRLREAIQTASAERFWIASSLRSSQ